MKHLPLAMLVSMLSFGGVASAQNTSAGLSQNMSVAVGVTESTDPAKIADVERRAQEIMTQQQANTSGASGTASAGAASETNGSMRMHKKPSKAHPSGMKKHRGDGHHRIESGSNISGGTSQSQ
jgi:hypothetical protein